MLGLWSRASQTSCRCRSCLHAATSVARGTTNIASKRRLTVGDLFTACYSTIFATAAVVDAQRKSERRKEWDRVIDEAKSEIPLPDSEASKASGSAGIFKKKAIFKLPNNTTERLLRVVNAGIPIGDVSRSDAAFEDPVRNRLRTPDSDGQQSLRTWNPLTGVPEVDSQEVTAGKARSFAESVLVERRPRRWTHVEQMELATSRLVTRLLLSTKVFSQGNNGSTSKPPKLSAEMKEVVGRLRTLQTRDTRLPSYTSIESFGERQLMNGSVNSIFQNYISEGSTDKDLLLAKICYNLLVSSTPPSVTTYNILIKSLSGLKLYEAAQIIIDILLSDSRFAPTDETLKIFLNHYASQKNVAGFRAIKDRMRGLSGGMHIKPKEHLIMKAVRGANRREEAGKELTHMQKWATVRRRPESRIEVRADLVLKVQRSAAVLDSLIQGCIRMGGRYSQAVVYMKVALRESRKIESDTFFNLVMGLSSRALRYQTGQNLLWALLETWAPSTFLKETPVPSSLEYCSKIRYAIRRLLALCRINTSISLSPQLPSHIPRSALKRMLKHMELQSATEKVHRISKDISRIQTVIMTALEEVRTNCEEPTDRCRASNDPPLSPDSSCGQVIHTAWRILHTSPTQKTYKTRESRGAAKLRMMGLGTIEKVLGFEDQKIFANQAALIHLTYHWLPFEWQKKYDDIIRPHPCMPLQEKFGIIAKLTKAYTQDTRHIESQIEISSRRIIGFYDVFARTSFAKTDPLYLLGSSHICDIENRVYEISQSNVQKDHYKDVLHFQEIAPIVDSRPIYVVEDPSGSTNARKEDSMTNIKPASVARDHSQISAAVQKKYVKLHIAPESWSKPKTRSSRHKERYDQQKECPHLPISSRLLTPLPLVVYSEGLKMGE